MLPCQWRYSMLKMELRVLFGLISVIVNCPAFVRSHQPRERPAKMTPKLVVLFLVVLVATTVKSDTFVGPSNSIPPTSYLFPGQDSATPCKLCTIPCIEFLATNPFSRIKIFKSCAANYYNYGTNVF